VCAALLIIEEPLHKAPYDARHAETVARRPAAEPSMEVGWQPHQEGLFHLTSHRHPDPRFRKRGWSDRMRARRFSASDRVDATGEKVPKNEIPVAF
jgi:hypothetical protein